MSADNPILDALGLPPLPSTSPDTIAALMWAREVLQNHQTLTYAVTDPNGIEELKPVNIGGVDQWLHIRGRNRQNPVLLYLHGGPGSGEIGGFDSIQRPWEDYFTVVHWDQRQTGKSYYPADDENSPITMEQFIEDTAEVMQYVREYLKKEKLFILGSSWGSVLGMHMVKRHPEWVHAYIGVGQVLKLLDSEKTIYKRLLHHAKAKNEKDLVATLEKITPLLDAEFPLREKAMLESCGLARKGLSRLAGEAYMHHTAFDDMVTIGKINRLISPHLTLVDLSNAILDDKIHIRRPPYHFTKEVMDHDLREEVGYSFEVPIFFFTGRHDWQTPVSLSDAWFEDISAPHKELIHFEESSHFVMNEEPGKFVVELVNRVLPFANADLDQVT